MKTLLSPGFALFLLLLIIPDFSVQLHAQSSSSNPIMIIRCRNFDEEVFKGNETNQDLSKMMDGCPDGYVASADGGCVPMCPPREFGSVTIEYTYNPTTGFCEENDCTPGASIDCSNYCPGDLFASGCDPCLRDGAGSNTDDYYNIDGTCYLTCFDGAITFDIPTTSCDQPTANGNVFVQLCFTSADAGMPLQDGQFVPVSDISNCLDLAGAENIDVFDGVPLNFNQDLGFGPAMGGEICIEFYADPNEPIVINLANAPAAVEIPTGCDIIPTMGQWALLILGLLFASLGLVYISRKKLA